MKSMFGWEKMSVSALFTIERRKKQMEKHPNRLEIKEKNQLVTISFEEPRIDDYNKQPVYMLKVVLHNSILKEACGLSGPDIQHLTNCLEMLEETIDLTAKS